MFCTSNYIIQRDQDYPKYTRTNWYGCPNRLSDIIERDSKGTAEEQRTSSVQGNENPVNIEIIDNSQG